MPGDAGRMPVARRPASYKAGRAGSNRRRPRAPPRRPSGARHRPGGRCSGRRSPARRRSSRTARSARRPRSPRTSHGPAPRDSASRPSAPLPANASSTRRPATSPSIANSASRARSPVGRVSRPARGHQPRPPPLARDDPHSYRLAARICRNSGMRCQRRSRSLCTACSGTAARAGARSRSRRPPAPRRTSPAARGGRRTSCPARCATPRRGRSSSSRYEPAITNESPSNVPAALIGWTTARHSRPPGTRTRAASRTAPAMSSMSISDRKATTRSNEPSAYGSAAASARSKVDRRIGLAGCGDHRLRAVDAAHVVAQAGQVPGQPALAAAQVERALRRRRQQRQELVAVELPVAVVPRRPRPADEGSAFSSHARLSSFTRRSRCPGSARRRGADGSRSGSGRDPLRSCRTGGRARAATCRGSAAEAPHGCRQRG